MTWLETKAEGKAQRTNVNFCFERFVQTIFDCRWVLLLF